jgi:hypothetical protein
MMKKLAVTIFVFSLTAVGCGSDDGPGPKKDAGLDAKTDVVAQPDTNQPDKATPGAEVQVGPEVQADKPITDVATPLDVTPKMDGQAVDVTTQVDGQTVDGGSTDTAIPGIDGGVKIDAQATEAAKAVDGGSVDGGTLG